MGNFVPDKIKEAQFADTVVNRNALIGLLEDIYDIDSMATGMTDPS